MDGRDRPQVANRRPMEPSPGEMLPQMINSIALCPSLPSCIDRIGQRCSDFQNCILRKLIMQNTMPVLEKVNSFASMYNAPPRLRASPHLALLSEHRFVLTMFAYGMFA